MLNSWIDNEQEEYLRRAMGFYFNMTDVDKNGVITVPEFIKLAINFGGDVKEGDSDVVKVTRNTTRPLFWS